jgi:hypothetical protein
VTNDADKIKKAIMEANDFTDFLRSYTTDSTGQRVLRGLTKQETDEYLAFKVNRLSGDATSDGRARWLQLHEKHEAARAAALNAERELRDKPTIN